MEAASLAEINMKLASHNTMTYQKPKQWWFRYLLPFVGKCQRKDYKKQHELGACGFDLRLFWDSDGNMEYRHGIIRYSANNIDDVLSYAQENGIIVRVLLEIRDYNANSVKDIETVRERFKSYCAEIEEKYPSVQFYNGRETGSGELLYTFKNSPHITVHELHSSTTSLFNSDNKFLRVLDDLFPIIYAKLRNKKNIEEYGQKDLDDTNYMMIDFVDIQ